MNQKFLSSINASGKLHMVPASLDGHYVIRFCVCAQNAANADIDHAYRVIAQFATDLFEIMDMEKKKNENRELKETEENEAADEVFMLDRKRQMSLRYKRSFFVRMVSDPKLYNPKIVKALNTSTSSLDDKTQQQTQQSQRHASEYEPPATSKLNWSCSENWSFNLDFWLSIFKLKFKI